MQVQCKSLSSWSILACLACLACSAGTASAQLGIPRFTVDCGGGGSTGGAFSVGGTAGQFDAGRMSGGSFVVAGGFWAGGGGVPAGVEDDLQADDGVEPGSPPLAFHLFPASPNPVAESMVLAFDLPETRFVRVEIYDLAGRLVRVLANEQVAAGKNQRAWDRRDQQGLRVPAGIYFVRFFAGSNQSRQKIVVLS